MFSCLEKESSIREANRKDDAEEVAPSSSYAEPIKGLTLFVINEKQDWESILEILDTRNANFEKFQTTIDGIKISSSIAVDYNKIRDNLRIERSEHFIPAE